MSGIDCHWKLIILSVRFICNRLVLLDLDVGQKCNQIRAAFISLGVSWSYRSPNFDCGFPSKLERIFCESRQHHPELQPASGPSGCHFPFSNVRKSDRWPILFLISAQVGASIGFRFVERARHLMAERHLCKWIVVDDIVT